MASGGPNKSVVNISRDLNQNADSFEKALELSSEFQLKEFKLNSSELFVLEFGKFNVIMILTSGLVLASVYMETVSISYVLPVSQCDLNWEIWERGILSAIGFVGIIVSSHFWGFLADTIGRKSVIMPTQLMTFGFSVLSSFSNSFWPLLILRFLNGIW